MTFTEGKKLRLQRDNANSKKPLPLSDKKFEKVLSLSSDWGVKTSEEEIDTYLYGKPKSPNRHK